MLMRKRNADGLRKCKEGGDERKERGTAVNDDICSSTNPLSVEACIECVISTLFSLLEGSD